MGAQESSSSCFVLFRFARPCALQPATLFNERIAQSEQFSLQLKLRSFARHQGVGFQVWLNFASPNSQHRITDKNTIPTSFLDSNLGRKYSILYSPIRRIMPTRSLDEPIPIEYFKLTRKIKCLPLLEPKILNDKLKHLKRKRRNIKRSARRIIKK